MSNYLFSCLLQPEPNKNSFDYGFSYWDFGSNKLPQIIFDNECKIHLVDFFF